METNGNSNKKKNSKRTLILGIAALTAAAALGAAFVLGSSDRSSEGVTTTTTRPASPTASTNQGDNPGGPEASDSGSAATQPDPTATPTSPATDDGDGAPETDDSTVTPEPDGGCNFCEDDGDLAPQPTSTPSCAFCPDGLDDLVIETPIGPDPCPDCAAEVGLALPVDVTPPIFESIDTTFCYPILQVIVEVDAPAEVWFEYSYDGVDYESNHMEAANSVNIGEDMADFDWAVYLISGYYVHAVDVSGNHSVSELQPMPDPDLVCD
jgi:hypothetical protein